MNEQLKNYINMVDGCMDSTLVEPEDNAAWLIVKHTLEEFISATVASPADALVAGDRVDTLQEIATKLRRAGADIPAPQHDDAIKGATINGLSIALLLIEDAIQSRYGDGNG